MYKSTLKYVGVALMGMILTTSCEKYLDKAPEVNITEQDVFSKFTSFQGFVEDLYQNVVDVTLCTDATMNFNWGDDVICSYQFMVGPSFEKGDYWIWQTTSRSPFNGTISGGATQTAKGTKGYWANGWYGIRNANIAISNVNKLIAGTQEERDLIAGQAYFFRGYLHFEILRSWGGIPYIDTVFSPVDQLKRPRLSYRLTADKITADLEKAAQLLPAVSWDQTVTGQTTLGNNSGRLTKFAAYGYLGKNLLYSASPLMNGEATGNFTYDVELCKKAAAAFNEVIKLIDNNYFGLEAWADYSKNFYSLTYNTMKGKEIVFSNPSYGYKRWNYGEQQISYLGGWGTYAGPTQNYVENFGMANGLPLENIASGYDASNPWINRDPRFYYSVIVDRDRLIKNTANIHTFAEFFINGRHRNVSNSLTGYGHRKYQHLTCNSYDNGWGNGYFWECPQMRLADVYLMYAEAANEAYGPTTVPPDIPGGLTAVAAINVIRARAGVPDVDASYLTTKEDFREQIRRERAVELAFENHRWYDLRRWYVAQDLKYREKYELQYDQPHSYFKKNLVLTTVFDAKHWWLPFPVAQVSLYPGFKQNPGW